MAEGSGLSALLNYESVPKIASLPEYLKQAIVPDATYRNWNAYQSKIHFAEGVNVTEAFSVLPDPQTNGGILFSVKMSAFNDIKSLLVDNGLADFTVPIGKMIKKEEKVIRLEN